MLPQKQHAQRARAAVGGYGAPAWCDEYLLEGGQLPAPAPSAPQRLLRHLAGVGDEGVVGYHRLPASRSAMYWRYTLSMEPRYFFAHHQLALPHFRQGFSFSMLAPSAATPLHRPPFHIYSSVSSTKLVSL